MSTKTKENFEAKLSRKVRSISPSGIRKFFELTIGMDDVISLGVGEPDFVTPWHIREHAIFALEKGYTMYTSNYGLLSLREKIADYLEERYDISYSPKNQILVTVGVSEGFDIALRAVLDPGDQVLIPEPGYVSYIPLTVMAGGDPVSVPTRPENGFKLTPSLIEKHITAKTKVLILNYPCNPTGSTYTRDQLLDIAAVARKHDLIVISDEIYENLTYDSPHVCFSSLPGMLDRTGLLNGLSKSYAMTGWRIGYIASNEKFIEAMMKIHQYSILCAPILSQMAAEEAFVRGDKAMRQMTGEYNKRRKFIVREMNNLGLDCHMPEGAFYIFPSIRKTGLSSEEFCSRLLNEEKVAVVPGNAFGACGEGFIRCSYATSLDNLEEAVKKIEKFLRNK